MTYLDEINLKELCYLKDTVFKDMNFDINRFKEWEKENLEDLISEGLQLTFEGMKYILWKKLIIMSEKKDKELKSIIFNQK